MIYEINGKLLEVSNEIKELDEYIFGRFSQFREIIDHKAFNYLKFKEDKVEILIDNNYKILNNRIIKTDIYPIVNNVISCLINDSNNLFIHSIVVNKNNQGTLIVGNFGQGKSTLASEFKLNGYEVNSTDQTWLTERDGKIYLNLGSRFDIINGEIRLLELEKSIKKVEIKQIIRVVGVCDNGDVSLTENKNRYHIIKNLSSFSSWNYSMPLFTDDVELFNTNMYIKKFLNKIVDARIQFIDARGDKRKILQELGENND